MGTHRFRLVAALVVAAAVAAPAAFAAAAEEITPQTPAPSAETGAVVDETPELWFVELAGKPVADGGSAAAIAREQSSFRAAAGKAGVEYTERFAFGTLWNGLSVRIDPSQIGALSRVSGVSALYPVATIEAPETTEVSPDLATALALTGADVAQSELGLTGAGVKVAIMDTGVDYHHPDLGGCFGPGCRVEAGHDFVGDAFAGPNTPVPDDDPDDCNGHGTHVAGIVGASGDVTGVAPGVTFGAYRVFGCAGFTTADIMVAAMERALADGMDVLNMSIGSAFNTWPQYPTAAASDRMVNAGMSVVASIGNSGANGVYSAGAPGVGTKVIGVASFDNTHISAPFFVVNPTAHDVAYFKLATTVDPPTGGTTPEIVYVGRGCTAAEVGDDDPYLADPNGKVALIDRGACTFNSKYNRAVDAGAVAVVIANNLPGLFAGGGVVDRGIPGVGISLEDGDHIKSQLPGATLTWADGLITTPNPSGGHISSFSSYGLNAELDVKPDIGAPGGLIRSTYPLEKGAYATVSGTSMSSPHVAGGVALLLEAKPRTPSNAIRSILQNSADPRPWWGIPNGPFVDNVHRQGAGMLDIDDAATATTKIEPGKIAVGEAGAPLTQTLAIENSGSAAVTYDLSHRRALATFGSTFAPRFTTAGAGVTFSAPSVTVPAGGTATVDVTITRPDFGAANNVVFGGHIVLTPQDGGKTYRVPYGGFGGDYQAIDYLGNSVGFPFLAVRSGTGFSVVSGGTFTMTGGDIPWVLVHTNHQARNLRVEVKNAATGRSFHRAVDLAYLPRNSTSTAFFALPFDGTTVNGTRTNTVPDGTYVLELSVLKALGDPANPAHTETWTSPTFTIDRP